MPTGTTFATPTRSDDRDVSPKQISGTRKKPIDSAEAIGMEEEQRSHVQVPTTTGSLDSTVEVEALDSTEENEKREKTSSRHSLLDDDQTDISDNYTWGRKKRRRKKRNREECQSSSDSESEGSCSSSRQIRLVGERLRYSSSCSSNGSSEQSKRSKGEKTDSKKCPTLGNKFLGVPPLLKVTAAEFHWPLAGDGDNSSRSMELISECEITVSANASYSPSKQELQSPPCPTLKHLTLQSESNDSCTASSSSGTASESPSSQSSSSTGEEADLGWTEAIIERSMNNLKKKFEELQSPCLDINDSYRHSGKSIRPILLT